jgi:C_GCAxxG_C_C family probable redox protein
MKNKETLEIIANALHDQGYNCSQSVFGALATELGLEQATALKIAAPLGGGIGRTGQTCGAVTGALLALGLVYGNASPDSAAKDRNYEIARQFMARFAAKNGSVRCSELLGADISTPEGVADARARGLFKAVCGGYIQDAVEMAYEMINLTPLPPSP